jgi:hypothetical protein
MYQPGTTLKLDFGTFYHYGIVDNFGMVIHNSKKWGYVRRDALDDFSEGRMIEIADTIKSENPQSSIERAKQMINAPYDLFTSNCEHFVRIVHGMEKESRQIQKYLISIGAVTVAARANNPYVKMASVGAALGAISSSEGESPVKKAAIGATLAVGVLGLIALLTS